VVAEVPHSLGPVGRSSAPSPLLYPTYTSLPLSVNASPAAPPSLPARNPGNQDVPSNPQPGPRGRASTPGAIHPVCEGEGIRSPANRMVDVAAHCIWCRPPGWGLLKTHGASRRVTHLRGPLQHRLLSAPATAALRVGNKNEPAGSSPAPFRIRPTPTA
jgi:hypothetical protein